VEPGKRGKPVVCFDGQLAGPRLLHFPCRAAGLVANDLTITGSIGVILHTVELSRTDGQGRPRASVTYKSGKFKTCFSGDRSTNEIPARNG